MNKKIALLTVSLVVIIFAFIAILVLNPFSSYAFKAESNNVLFLSNYKNPVTYLKELAAEKELMIVASVHEPTENIDQHTSNGLKLFLIVLTGNDVNAIQLYRVLNASGEMFYCVTNFGDLKTEERLEIQECQSMIDDSERIVVIIELPDSQLEKPQVVLAKNRVQIRPRHYSEIGSVSFLVLKAMFGNAQELLEMTNELVKKVSGQ